MAIYKVTTTIERVENVNPNGDMPVRTTTVTAQEHDTVNILEELETLVDFTGSRALRLAAQLLPDDATGGNT